MSAPLTKDLRKKHGVRSMPVRKDDEVVIVRGAHKKEKGKVIAVYRKKWCIHIEKITKTKANGMALRFGLVNDSWGKPEGKSGKAKPANSLSEALCLWCLNTQINFAWEFIYRFLRLLKSLKEIQYWIFEIYACPLSF